MSAQALFSRALLALALLSAAASADSAARAPKQYPIDVFMKSTKVGGASFSPDEKTIYFHSNQTGIFNVFAAPTAGGEAKPVTHSTKESTFLTTAFPHDGRIVFTQDKGGDENSHLFVRDGDKERDLTPGAKVKARFLGWRHDGKAFFFGTNERDPKSFDVYRMDAAKLERTLVFKAEDPAYAVDGISQDGRFIAMEKSNTTVDSDVYVYDVEKKERRHLTPHQGQATHSFTGFDHPARNAFIVTNAGREFGALAKFDLATGKSTVMDAPEWDVMYSVLSKNGKYRVTAINEDARTRIKVIENATGNEVKLPADLGEGDITSVKISDSEKKMAFYFNGDRSPSDLYVLDIPTNKVTRLTRSLNPQIDPKDLVDSEVVRFKSFDELQIPNILYKPQQASAAHKAPALVWVHGGPGGQTRKGYSPVLQFLANHGYVVLGINNRGSSGYGKTFFTADDRKHGKEPLWDCVEAKKYLQSLDYVDGEKIGIIGGSYGGYMTLAALAFKPDVFDVGVDIFGVSNWLRTLESIPPYWESFRKVLYQEIGDPSKDREMLKEISPLFHAGKIRKPLLVLQGANDPRVIKPESDEIVEAVKKNGVPVEYVLFPDEGHGFTKRENEMKAYGAIVKFLDEHLKKGTSEKGSN